MTEMFPSLILSLIIAHTPLWQYTVPFTAGARQGTAYCWIPPQTRTVRGVVLIGQLGIEGELYSFYRNNPKIWIVSVFLNGARILW